MRAGLRMNRQLGIIIFVFLISPLTLATSTLSKEDKIKHQQLTGAVQSHCKIVGEYAGDEERRANSKERSVVWKFKILNRKKVNSGRCPTGTDFDLTIRGAERTDGYNVYPVHISEPELKSECEMAIERVSHPKFSKQWIVKDWNEDFRCK